MRSINSSWFFLSRIAPMQPIANSSGAMLNAARLAARSSSEGGAKRARSTMLLIVRNFSGCAPVASQMIRPISLDKVMMRWHCRAALCQWRP